MKKVVAWIMMACLLFACGAVCVSATASPEKGISVSGIFSDEDGNNATVRLPDGTTKKVDIENYEYTDETGKEQVANLVKDLIIRLIPVSGKSADWDIGSDDGHTIFATDGEPWADSEKILEGIGDKYEDYKVYGAFDIQINEEGKLILGDTVLESVNLKVYIPGLNDANVPMFFKYDPETDTYEIVKDAKFGNEASQLYVEFYVDGIGCYGIVYLPEVTSPATDVDINMIVCVGAILVLATFGAAYAGKKALAKQDN